MITSFRIWSTTTTIWYRNEKWTCILYEV